MRLALRRRSPSSRTAASSPSSRIPSHPTGQALCAKGRAAPELVYHPDRLLHPLKRTRPKGDPDPGWQRISWDEALDLDRRERCGGSPSEHGPESVVFSRRLPSTSAIVGLARLDQAPDARLRHARTICVSMELCGWGRYLAARYTYGTAGARGAYMPDLEHAGCILFWGYNPSIARIAHATATVAALKRGARLIVVDPRQAGLADKADSGCACGPAPTARSPSAIAGVMIERGWYDRGFRPRLDERPLLVRSDTGRLLTERDLSPAGSGDRYVAWDRVRACAPVVYDPATGRYEAGRRRACPLRRVRRSRTRTGTSVCRPGFELVAELCRRLHPGDGRGDLRGRPRRRSSRPPGCSGRRGRSPTTPGAASSSTPTPPRSLRAIALLYALTGSFDCPGGNVLFPAVPHERDRRGRAAARLQRAARPALGLRRAAARSRRAGGS